MSAPRWEGDDRGEGVADATSFATGAGALLEAMRSPNWVAEQPEAHLLPHLQRACASLPVELLDARTAPDGSFDVQLRWSADKLRVADVRAAVFSLIGSFAEASTYMRQRRTEAAEQTPDMLLFEVVTGFTSGDGAFAAHGHTLRISVSAGR